MRRRSRASNRMLLAIGGLLGLALLLIGGFGPAQIELSANRVADHSDYAVSEQALERHRGLIVADWHADSLLWSRDLRQRGDRGQVDFPRLIEGNVAIQMFTAVTKSPRGQNYHSNTGDSDNITFLTLIQRWPAATWNSLLARALHQAARLEAYAEGAPQQVRLVRSASELRRVLAQRDSRGGPVAALLGIEGAHALEGEIENLDVLHRAGFRMIGLHHFFDNALGGSLHGAEGASGAGLSEFGRAVVRRSQASGMMVDVAHSSPAVVDDVLAIAQRPIVVSHTGVYGQCPSERNLRDAQLKRIAAAGGLIGIGYWEGAICDITPAGVVRSIRYAIDLVGEDHVALGSDYDGSVTTTFDTSELAVLTQTMIDARFTASEIEKVMGRNTVRFLLEQLP